MPSHYFDGLGKIVLTNSTALPSNRRKHVRRQSKRGPQYVLGTYYRASRGQPARIEMYIDNIVRQYPPWSLCLPLLCDILLGETFFHELGHHLHRTKRPEYRNPELVADDWGELLQRRYVRKRYWYIRIILFPCLLLRHGLKKFQRSRRAA